MFSIGITGAIGVGKTTFAELLGGALGNCRVIHGDNYMKKRIAKTHKGHDAGTSAYSGHANSKLHMYEYYKTPEIARTTFQLIKDPMNTALQFELLKSKQYSFCIIEWNYLQKLPMWNDFDERFQIYTSWETRLARLWQRDEESEMNRNVTLRMNNLDDDAISNDSISLSNDGTLEALQRLAFITAKELQLRLK